MRTHIISASVAAAAMLMLGSLAVAGETPAPEGASVYIIAPEDGATVSGPVTVLFGLEGAGVAPAGVENAMTGHHHLFVNRPPFGEGPDGMQEAEVNIPSDDTHIHFGGGQTQTVLELPAGDHTLQLVLGDHNHIPHDPPVVSEVITITVE